MDNKLKQEECGISVKLWGKSIEIASEEYNAKEKLVILWKHANRVTLIIHLWLKRLILKKILSFWIELGNTRKGLTRDQNIDSYEDISFLGKIYCFYQKGKRSFEKSWFLLHMV